MNHLAKSLLASVALFVLFIDGCATGDRSDSAAATMCRTRSMVANLNAADPAVRAYARDIYEAASKAGLHKGADFRALRSMGSRPENPFLGARVGIIGINYSVDPNGKFRILNLTNSPAVSSAQIRHVREVMTDAGRELKPLPDHVKSVVGDHFTDWMIFDWVN